LRVLPLVSMCVASIACIRKVPELFPAPPCAYTTPDSGSWKRVELTTGRVQMLLPPVYVFDESLPNRTWFATQRGSFSVYEATRDFDVADSTIRVNRCNAQLAGRDVRINTLADYGHWGPFFTTVATWEESPGKWMWIYAVARDSLIQAEQVAAVHTLRR
jgi:hypothetical protein